MRSLPTSIKEYEDNVRWVFHNYMELIEEIVCDPSAFGTGGPDVEEVIERVQQAVELGDGEAEDKAILEGMKVQTRELWGDFPERELLGEHFRRAALRRAGTRLFRRHRPSQRRGGPAACGGHAGPPSGQIAEVPDPGRGLDEPGVGIRNHSKAVGRHIPARTFPSTVAGVHQTLAQQGLLRSSRPHTGRSEAPGQGRSRFAGEMASGDPKRGPWASPQEAHPKRAPRRVTQAAE